MKYTIGLSFFLVLSSNLLFGQSFKFELQPGIGFYSMNDLKDINDDVSQEIPFNTKLVSDFPAYWYLRPTFSLQFKKFSLGLNYSFQSTGSRVSAKDYSGEYRFDMKVNSSSPGIYSEVLLGTLNKIRFNLYSVLGVSFSKLSLNEYLIVLDQIITDDIYRYKAQSYYIEPGFNLTYPVQFLNAGLYAGYLIQFGKQAFYSDDNKDNKLYAQRSRDPIKPDWKGLRIGISVYYNLSRKTN